MGAKLLHNADMVEDAAMPLDPCYIDYRTIMAVKVHLPLPSQSQPLLPHLVRFDLP